jgi:hypothetical protein
LPPSAETSAPAADPAATAPSGWKVYTHPRWGYSVAYPATWFNLGNFGVPDTDKYFSNENVGAPLQLDKQGIWLTIRVADGTCPAPPALGPGQKQLVVGGQSVVRTSGHSVPAGAENTWTIAADVPGGGSCFSFIYVALSQSARDANLEVADRMITTLKLRGLGR